jgi:hypothetical protein
MLVLAILFFFIPFPSVHVRQRTKPANDLAFIRNTNDHCICQLAAYLEVRIHTEIVFTCPKHQGNAVHFSW